MTVDTHHLRVTSYHHLFWFPLLFHFHLWPSPLLPFMVIITHQSSPFDIPYPQGGGPLFSSSHLFLLESTAMHHFRNHINLHNYIVPIPLIENYPYSLFTSSISLIEDYSFASLRCQGRSKQKLMSVFEDGYSMVLTNWYRHKIK